MCIHYRLHGELPSNTCNVSQHFSEVLVVHKEFHSEHSAFLQVVCRLCGATTLHHVRVGLSAQRATYTSRSGARVVRIYYYITIINPCQAPLFLWQYTVTLCILRRHVLLPYRSTCRQDKCATNLCRCTCSASSH